MENNKITYDNIEYYDVNYINTINPAYFRGCSGKLRKIIGIKKIPTEHYIYAYHSNGNLVISNKSYLKAHLFLDREWVDENISGMKDTTGEPVVDILPDLIELDDHEQFIGHNGEKLNITIRGDREKREFFFRVKDIVDEFEMPGLHDTISDKRYDGYIEGTHYKYFYRKEIGSPRNLSTDDPIKKSNKRFLYLTYGGLIRCLYVSRSKNADKFQKWATNILFTHQFGSADDRQGLASKLTGATPQVIKEFCKTSSAPISCIYLFSLGPVRDLRKSMQINNGYDDKMIVCKYGKTDDLERRTKEHINTYGVIKGCHLTLICHCYIDPKYTSKAEGYIKGQIVDHLEYKNHTELTVINKKTIKKIKEHFKVMRTTYAADIQGLHYKVNDLENKLALEKANHEIIEGRLKADVSGKKYEIENMKLKHEIELMKLEQKISSLEKSLATKNNV